MYRTRVNYWGCSRFADWLRSFVKVKKPNAATMEDWDEWKKTYKESHPFNYWLTEEFLDNVQNVVMFIPDIVDEARYYLRNRFFDKLHYLPTKLKPGQYYDLDTRLLHGMFESFVDFIEIEKAWMHVVFNAEDKKKYNYPWWTRKRWTHLIRFRCPEAGLDHIAWEISLDSDPSDVENYVPSQAADAREQLALYKWWKETRPARPDPYDASGWSEICERQIGKGSFLRNKNRTEEEEQEARAALDKSNEIEQQYDNEDTEMMIRLIKIRKGLWT